MRAVAELAKIEIEIVANDENIGGWDFIEMSEKLGGLAGIIVEILRLEKNCVADFCPNSVIFRFLPSEIVSFGIKIKR